MASKTKRPDPGPTEATALAPEETETTTEPAAATESEIDEQAIDFPQEGESKVEEAEEAPGAEAEKASDESPDLEPSGFDAPETEAPAPKDPNPAEAPLTDFIMLNGLASFGPVIIGGRSVRCKKNVLYQVPNVAERATILGTGRFRTATKKDQARAGRSSAGPGGAVTRDLLPPGALKGGLNTP